MKSNFLRKKLIYTGGVESRVLLSISFKELLLTRRIFLLLSVILFYES